ncbi:MAG: hypothetical protein IT301_11945 [Dehalococcoidia bacterium]|nr:hypothetical protein [Dehalococcoidia bacterium]
MGPGNPLQYTRSRDGTRIAWQDVGSGPAILVVPSWPSTLATQTWRWFVQRVWQGRTVVYDRRGFGASDWGVEHSVDRYVEDVEAVADAAGLERLVIYAIANGSAEAVTLAARSQRVTRMLLAEPALHPEKEQHSEEAALVAMIDGDFRMFWSAMAQWILGWGSPGPVGALVDRYLAATNPDDIRAFLAMHYSQVNLRPLAPMVRADCLIFHNAATSRSPSGPAEELARLIPNARLLLGRERKGWATHGEAEMLRNFLGGSRLVNESVDDHGPTVSHGIAHTGLTPREVEILEALRTGKTNEELAEQFTLSKATVARHLANIYGKLGVRNRVEATNWAAQQAKQG